MDDCIFLGLLLESNEKGKRVKERVEALQRNLDKIAERIYFVPVSMKCIMLAEGRTTGTELLKLICFNVLRIFPFSYNCSFDFRF